MNNKKTTLTKLTNCYDSLSHAIGSFTGAVGYVERTRELEWVKSANREIIEALSHGVRQSAASVDTVKRATELSSRADDMEVNLAQEAARSIRLMAKLETNGASAERQEHAAKDYKKLLVAIAESDITTAEHMQSVAAILNVDTPRAAQVYNFATRRRVA